ncbi:hypothetical protein [Streptomyces scabiei]|uniref:hypothetical protein n=2 Tax=Streptomyces scabiei TaxID=1930 RepID=UPI000A9DF7A7|nr:hypothetical protein [Streptomyces scabiei]MDX3028523.1 hypothetical protein [Streptomyces scabiei]
MRQPFVLAASLAALLLAGGCVALPAGTSPPAPHLHAAVARTASPLPSPHEPSARSALIAPAPTLVKTVRTKRPDVPRPAAQRRSSLSDTRPQRPAAPRPSARPRTAVRTAPARPAPPSSNRHRTVRPRTAPPEPTYDMRTVCSLAHQAAAPSGAGTLCDTYLR